MASTPATICCPNSIGARLAKQHPIKNRVYRLPTRSPIHRYRVGTNNVPTLLGYLVLPGLFGKAGRRMDAGPQGMHIRDRVA
jgi:hypothetical protein